MAQQIFGLEDGKNHNYMGVNDNGSINTENLVRGVKYKDGNGGIDKDTNNIVTIDQSHHEMHEGDHYFFKSFIEDTTGGGLVNATLFAFITPATSKRIHARALLTPDVDFTVNIYVDADITGGTPLNGVNNDGDSTNVAELNAFGQPTVNDKGSLIWAARNGGGKNPVGVSPGFNYEIIAKTNATYLFEIIKNVPQTGIVDIDFWWYEHTPRN